MPALPAFLSNYTLLGRVVQTKTWKKSLIVPLPPLPRPPFFFFLLCWVFTVACKLLELHWLFPDQGSNLVPCIGRWIRTPWTTREVSYVLYPNQSLVTCDTLSVWESSSSLFPRTPFASLLCWIFFLDPPLPLASSTTLL